MWKFRDAVRGSSPVSILNSGLPARAGKLTRFDYNFKYSLTYERLSLQNLSSGCFLAYEDLLDVQCSQRRTNFEFWILICRLKCLRQKCCGALFNPTPFFTSAGTCFTTNQQILEVLPFTFSSIKIWLNLQSDNSPGTSSPPSFSQNRKGQTFLKYFHWLSSEFEVIFKGSDALDRNGVFYTISENDHPVTKLLQLPFKAQRGTNVLISLNVQQVRDVVNGGGLD